MEKGLLHLLLNLLRDATKCLNPWQGQIKFADLRGIDIDIDNPLASGRGKEYYQHKSE
jgi:hypothetical protein